MRSRKHADEQVAEVARRRLALLSAELAGLRPDPVDTPVPGSQDGAGELGAQQREPSPCHLGDLFVRVLP